MELRDSAPVAEDPTPETGAEHLTDGSLKNLSRVLG